MELLGTPRQVIVPVADVGAAVAFYQAAYGLELRFQDGERWAALELGGLTLALAGSGERPAGDELTLGIKVADVDTALTQVEQAGGQVLSPPADGPHERRATCRDAFGTPLVLYAALAAPS